MRHIAKSLQMLLNSARSVIFSWFVFCVFSTPALAATVIEFYNTPLDHYFITADANEAAAIDSGSAGLGWSRTGNSFNSGGTTSVCRFYGSQSPGPNSHFYTADAGECAYLKQLQASTPGTQKRWNYESQDFVSTPPANGACSAGTEPVYRAYNNGSTRNVDSNHRITSSQTAIQEVVNRGWENEGVVMCAPLCTAPAVWNGTACAVASTATALTLIAGTTDTPGSTNGTLLTASFHYPRAIAKDAQGNLYVADGCDGAGKFDNHGLIRKIAPSGDVTSIAGSASYGGMAHDGVGDQAKFKCIIGMTATPDGNIYTSDRVTRIVQRITPKGEVTTIAGVRDQPGSADGTAMQARLHGGPITSDKQGNLFFTDDYNHTIRKIDTLGNVTTYAGQAGVIGDADGLLQSARFKYPSALKFDSGGKLYVGDLNGIRVISNGSVSTAISFAQIMTDFCPGSSMPLDDIDVSDDGRIAVAVANCRSVGIYQNNHLSVLIGKDWDVNDYDGTPSASRFYFPGSVAFLPNGDLFISDFGHHNIKRYSASTNSVSLYAGQRNYIFPIDGVGSTAKLNNSVCLYHSASGEIWFSQDSSILRRVDATGNVTTLPVSPNGSACVLKVNEDGSFISASILQELGLYSPTGQILRTLATQLDIPSSLYSAVSANGDIFFTNNSGGITKYSGGVVSEFTQPIANYPLRALAITKTGDFVAARISSIVNVSASGVVTELAGSETAGDYLKDGTTADARFSSIGGLAVGTNGAIYVSQLNGSVIRRIYNGNVDTIAGTPWINETKIGSVQGSIYDPREIAYDAASNSLIILTGNAILRAQLPQ